MTTFENSNILFYSSFILLTNVAVGLLTSNHIYSILFATLFVTSVVVHTTNHINSFEQSSPVLDCIPPASRPEYFSFSFDAPASHLLKISDLLPSSKSVNPIVVNLLDKLVIFLIFLYGGYRLYEKRYMTWWGIAKMCIIVSTCLFVVWVYCYGYLTGDLCFHPVKEIGAIYHVFMHIVGSLGHNMIMLF